MTECRKKTEISGLFRQQIVNRSCPLALLILSREEQGRIRERKGKRQRETIAYNRLECGCGQRASFPFPLHSPLLFAFPPFHHSKSNSRCRCPFPATARRRCRVKTHKRFFDSLRFWKQSNNRKLDEPAGEEGSQEEPRKKRLLRTTATKEGRPRPSVFGH